ncbi:MAG: PAS domain-containing protein [Chroococcidiopsidaceae cyanobacterium CP_BM_ER_R8_30]|nr:PAS domain-containing protein [Chroococcidiopsidaceae cyanobacterium CP_BM_ER_R8_30]
MPLKASRVGEGYFLVLFEKSLALVPSSTEIASASHYQLKPDQVTSDEQEITRLRQELAVTKEELASTKKHLQAIIEEQEATNQDLRVANAEISASNEELQSTNEELETAKEEIQVTNEELTRLNSELHQRNIEANQVSNDLQNLLSSTSIPMLMLGRELIIRRFTPSAQSIFNLIPTDVGRPIGDINHNLNIPDLEAQVLKVIHTLSVKEQEVQDQEGHWYELQIRPYRTHDSRIDGAVLLLQDITQRKRFEEQRQQLLVQEQKAREAAEAANRAKDEFLSIISHELRSPLNSVIGWSQLLRRQSFDTAQTAHALEMIENAAKLQATLIADLLDISQLTTVNFQLNTSSIDLMPVIETAIDLARPLAEAKNLQMEAVLERNPLFVAGDAQRLQQVMGNLLSNAVKFTPAGGKVTVKLERAETLAQIQVSDTGQGISAKFLPHVFERFTQADGSRTRAKGGLGLGLAIVRHLVERHGGTVSATSPGEGQGATFLVELPLLIESQRVGERAAIAPPEPLAPSSLNDLHILVVDDDPGILELLKIILEQIAQVTAVTSAAEAIALLNANPGEYDLLLSDIGMPNEDGYTLIRQVRALGADFRRIPAVALTAYVGGEEPSEVLAAGFQRYVPKPVEPVQLVSVIAELIKAPL